MMRLAPSTFSFLIPVILGMLASGCAALGPKTEGTVGAIHWYVTDLRQGNPFGSYPFTLVLAETRGVGMQITHIGWRAHQPGVTSASGILVCSQMAMIQMQGQVNVPQCGDWKGWRLAANDELRVPLSIGILCPNCSRSVIPLWEVTVAGTDDQGQPVRAVIDIRLPAR